jgi:copper resistance protein B
MNAAHPKRGLLFCMLAIGIMSADAWAQDEHVQKPSPGAAPAHDDMQGMSGMQGMAGMQDMGGSSTDQAMQAHPADATPVLTPNGHVPPPPPTFTVPDMSSTTMAHVMDMHDNDVLGMFKLEQLERLKTNEGYATAWDGEGWIGNDRDKLWIRSEGERDRDGTHDATVELFWDRAFAPFWDWQLGVRQDFGTDPTRQWAAFGVQGLAPYWFELQATAYVGADGRTAARVEATYDVLFTQRLILTPKLELNLYGKNDPRRSIGAGLSDIEAGLRLRYEINRHIAPYIGVDWKNSFANTSRYERARGNPSSDVEWLAGIRIWF